MKHLISDRLSRPRVLMVFPYAPSYREPIYKLMDKEFDCEFCFCKQTYIKLKYMDYSLLKHCDQSLEEVVLYRDWIYFKHISKIDLKRFDLVILPGTIRNLSVWSLMMKIKLFHPKLRTMIWTHGAYGKETKIQYIIKKLFFCLPNKILLYGNYAKKIILEHNLAKERKLVVVYNSLDYELQKKFRIKESENLFYDHFFNNNKNLVFIGRLTPVKKLDLVVYAIELLKRRNLHFNLTFIGDGSERQSIVDIAKQLGVVDSVWMYGECFEEAEISKLLNFADLCVSPGNVGLTAMHALAYGVPVATHNNFKKQMPEFEAITPGKTGFFFKENSVEDLADSIERWFETNKERERVRNECIAEIEAHYNPKTQLEILKSIINN